MFRQFAQIANTFGAGLAGFIAEQMHFAISNVRSSYPVLTYYGQDSGKCTTMSGKNYSGYSTQNLTQYYGNAYVMSSAASEAVESQTNNTGSPYYALENSEYLRNTPVSEKSCETQRRAELTDQEWITDGGSVIKPSCQAVEKVGYNKYECWLETETACSLTEKFQVNGSFYVYLYSPDDFYGYVKIGDKTVFSYNAGITGGTTPYTYEKTLITSGPQWVIIHVQNNGECNGKATAEFAIFLRRSEKVKEIKNDSCSNLNLNGCRLKDEQVCDQTGQNCVYTIKDYNTMGIDLLKNCQAIQDAQTGLTWLVCVNGSSMTYETNPESGLTPAAGTLETGQDIWWDVKKTFTCKTKQITVPSLAREKNIEEYGQYNASTGVFSYPDNTTRAYGLGGYNGTFYVQARSQTYGKCAYTCIVRTHPTRTSVIMSGSETTNAPPQTPRDISNEDKYLLCKKDNNGNWYCPATGNEDVVQQCVCLDRGVSTIATMSALIDAAKDLTCSKE